MPHLRTASIAFAIVFFSTIAPAALHADVGERLSSLADQRGVSLTIYNKDLALVRDVRRVALGAGLNRIALRDVSAQMNPSSALLRSTTDPSGLAVIEQNFNYDLLSPARLLEKYVGRTVTVVRMDPRTGAEVRENAKVLSLNDGTVLQYANRIETSVNGRIIFPEIPRNFRDRPTLVVDLEDRAAKTDTLELSYLTGGLSWQADYVGELDPSDKLLDLNGLVTLRNESGTDYRDARLQLVAGDVNQVPVTLDAKAAPNLRDIARVTSRASAESLFEYHLYTMPRTTSIADKQMKQIALLGAHGIPVSKTYELRGGGYYTDARSDLGSRLPIGVYVQFLNEGGELGIALPRGTIRIYKRDSAGTAQFIGEDRIEHTPRKETVRLHLGDAFDLTARRKQTDFARTINANGQPEYNSAYELEIKNAKTEPVTVSVIESLWGTWDILGEDHPHEKTSSATATWRIAVPASGSETLHYRVRVR